MDHEQGTLLPLPPLTPDRAPAGSPAPYLLPYLPPPLRPRIWTVFAAFVLALISAFGAQLIAYAIIVVIMVVRHPDEPLTAETIRDRLMAVILQPLVLLGFAFFTQLILISLSLAAAWLSPEPLVQRLRIGRAALSVTGYAVGAIGVLASGVLAGAITSLLRIKPSGTLEMLNKLFQELRGAELAVAVLVIGAGAGVAEELLFRGYIQTRLVRRLGPGWGIAIAAILFGIMHMDPVQGPLVVPMGMVLGYVAHRAGSIRPSMFCHAFNNSIAVILSVLLNRHAEKSAPAAAAAHDSAASALAQLFGGLIVLSLCLWYFRKRVPRPEAPYESRGFAPVVPTPP